MEDTPDFFISASVLLLIVTSMLGRVARWEMLCWSIGCWQSWCQSRWLVRCCPSAIWSNMGTLGQKACPSHLDWGSPNLDTFSTISWEMWPWVDTSSGRILSAIIGAVLFVCPSCINDSVSLTVERKRPKWDPSYANPKDSRLWRKLYHKMTAQDDHKMI